MTINDRIKILVDSQFKGNGAAFSRALGTKGGVTHKWLSDKSTPTGDSLSKISIQLGISPTWLLEGTGPMLKADLEKQPEQKHLTPCEEHMQRIIDLQDDVIRLQRENADLRVTLEKFLVKTENKR